MTEGFTTIEITPKVILGLDREKEAGETYDHLIRRLLTSYYGDFKNGCDITIDTNTKAILDKALEKVKSEGVQVKNLSDLLDFLMKLKRNRCAFCINYDARWSTKYRNGKCNLTNKIVGHKSFCDDFEYDDCFDDDEGCGRLLNLSAFD